MMRGSKRNLRMKRKKKYIYGEKQKEESGNEMQSGIYNEMQQKESGKETP